MASFNFTGSIYGDKPAHRDVKPFPMSVQTPQPRHIVGSGFGIPNQGSTCWLNSMLQALFNLPGAPLLRSSDGWADLANQIYLENDFSQIMSLARLFNTQNTRHFPINGYADATEALKMFINHVPELQNLFHFVISSTSNCHMCRKRIYNDEIRETFLFMEGVPDQFLLEFNCVASNLRKCSDCKCETYGQLVTTAPEFLIVEFSSDESLAGFPKTMNFGGDRYSLSSVLRNVANCHWTVDCYDGNSMTNYNDSEVGGRGAGVAQTALYARV